MTTRVYSPALLLALAMPSPAAANDGWDWSFAPYLWAPTIAADLREDAPPAENQRDFGDWIDKLEFAFLGHLEGRGDRVGLFADVIYLSLGDSHDYPRLRTEADLDAGIVELAAVLPLGDERSQGLDLFTGLRYFNVGTKTRFEPVNDLLPVVSRDRDATFSDLMLGARYTMRLSDRWGLTVRGDGSVGETDGSWSASANVQYRTGHGFWVFGYRYLQADLPMRGSSVDLALSGPQVGYAFTF
ncbi:hypothetical protein ACHZ97_09410 [Lysobacter soli]|uniref:hypothetical protein n=1 Tax=Lysobacter soli TaxID=453783 RepID=UPI0037CA38A4